MPQTPALSLVIVSYNTRELLRRCLISIVTHAGEVETIVVDNASADGSAEMVTAGFPGVILMCNAHNRGFAAATNQGLRQAHGEVLLLLNSDTEILPGSLQRARDFLETHPDAGGVGCKLLNSDGSLQRSCESFPNLPRLFSESFFLEQLFPRSRRFGQLHLTYFDYRHDARVDYVKGAFLMIRRQALEQVGLLDEKFFFYAEEMDWCYRAQALGWRIYFTPAAAVIHHGGSSSDPLSPRMFVQLHRSRFHFYRKHHGALASFAARLLLIAGAGLRLVAWAGLTLVWSIGNRARAAASWKKTLAFWGALRWYLGGQPAP